MQYIFATYREGVDFAINKDCSTCLDLFNPDIMRDKVIVEMLKNE